MLSLILWCCLRCFSMSFFFAFDNAPFIFSDSWCRLACRCSTCCRAATIGRSQFAPWFSWQFAQKISSGVLFSELDFETGKDSRNQKTRWILLMAEILHQFIGSLSHYLEGFSTIPGGWEWDFSHQQYPPVNDHIYFLYTGHLWVDSFSGKFPREDMFSRSLVEMLMLEE